MRRQRKKMNVAFLGVLLLSALVWWSEKDKMMITEEGTLFRRENGEGWYEAEVMLAVDSKEEMEWSIIVPEQALTEEEEMLFLTGAVSQIETEFAGDNTSMDCIRDKVVIRDHYQDGKVTAEWEFSNHRLIADTGLIEDDALQDESELVRAKVCLVCEDSSLIHEFYFVAWKREKSEEEQFREKINQLILENGEKEGTEILWLPTELEGHTLAWKNKESYLPLQVFALGMIVVLLLPALDAEREKEEQKKREEKLKRAYPELVNKLVLLLGAGMTLQGAWRQITAKYAESSKAIREAYSVLYEEMLITQREIDSGQGEARAYLAFGERCGVPKYRKLSGLLVQGLKKGSYCLCEMLEREAEEAFDERKNMAQQYGEEAGTKLLLPMLLMLGVVVVVIMVPAVISFRAGVG